jgi:hypothetical protein
MPLGRRNRDLKGLPMKSALAVFALALLSLSAFAQDEQEPTPPSYCKPCLFYGGDFDISGPSPNALLNQNTYVEGSSAVYVPFAVPPNQTWTVAGLFSNNMLSTATLDPPQMQWSISTGISQGNPGIVIASGTAQATLTPTGRSWNGMNEYTALGRLNANELVTLTPGHYWMTAVPQCTVQSIRSPCSGARYYMSDVEDVPPPEAKGFESLDESYLFGAGQYFSETGGPNGICSQEGGGGGCDKFSAGLLGTATPDN